MSFYEKRILPHVLNCVCGTNPVMRQRQKVVPRAQGTVLEIGIGTGLNLAYYDPARVARVIGLDPSEAAWKLAAERARHVSFPLEFIGLPGEEIPLDDSSIDTVVMTYSLCTIPDPLRALGGMLRVLKPGGRLLFCEHGRAPDAAVARWQDRLDNLWGRVSGGCHLNRDVSSLLEAGGFALRDVETMYLPGSPRFAGFNTWGEAGRA